MPKTNLQPLYPLIGKSHEEWDKFLQTTGPSKEAREARQAVLAEWYDALVRTTKEVEWACSNLEGLKAKDIAVAQAVGRKRRKSEGRLALREFLSLPILAADEALRNLRLTSRTGAEMRLEVLSFSGTAKCSATNVNLARELFQKGEMPKALWGLYYIRDGERSSGYGWDKPVLDEVYVHIHHEVPQAQVPGAGTR